MVVYEHLLQAKILKEAKAIFKMSSNNMNKKITINPRPRLRIMLQRANPSFQSSINLLKIKISNNSSSNNNKSLTNNKTSNKITNNITIKETNIIIMVVNIITKSKILFM